MIFRAQTPDRLAEQQIVEARMALLEHEAAAEFNGAMARMLAARIVRLQSFLNQLKELSE